jgi:hypothetical protein
MRRSVAAFLVAIVLAIPSVATASPFFWAMTAISVIGLVGGGVGGVVLGGYEIALQVGCELSDCEDVAVSPIEGSESNPDLMFVDLVAPASLTLTPVGGTGDPAFEAAVNASFSALSGVIADTRALTTTLERYYGALDAGDPFCAGGLSCSEFQAAFAGDLVVDIEAGIATFAALAAQISGSPLLSGVSVSAQDLEIYRDSVLLSGLFPTEAAAFAELGGTPADFARLITLFESLDPADIPAGPLTASSALALVTDGLTSGAIDVRAELPASFSVPEPGVAILWGIGLPGVLRLARSRGYRPAA